MRQPKVTMIAGPNGSGKTTLIAELIKLGADFGEHWNADEIAKTLGPPSEAVSREAQLRVREARTRALANRSDYSWETVMSHPSHILHLDEARACGYQIDLIYVATEDPLVSVRRVAHRVRVGGHDVPEDRVRERYAKSIALLPRAILAADAARVFDNSTYEAPFRRIATLRDDIFEAEAAKKLPFWFLPVLEEMQRYIAE